MKNEYNILSLIKGDASDPDMINFVLKRGRSHLLFFLHFSITYTLHMFNVFSVPNFSTDFSNFRQCGSW